MPHGPDSEASAGREIDFFFASEALGDWAAAMSSAAYELMKSSNNQNLAELTLVYLHSNFKTAISSISGTAEIVALY